MNYIGLFIISALCLTYAVSCAEFISDNQTEDEVFSLNDQQVDDGELDYDDFDDLDDLLEEGSDKRRRSQTRLSLFKANDSYVTKSIQMAISTTIGVIETQTVHDILLKDFEKVDSVFFPRGGSDTTPEHQYYNFKFKTMAPSAYHHFRDMFGVSTEEYISSIGNPEKPLRAIGNPGASGSALYLSHDDKYIIKTIKAKEADFLVKLLAQYYINLKQNPKTLLPKFLGQYNYVGGGRQMRLIVMNNLLPSAIRMDEKYDLKGSTYLRQASEHELAKSSPTLKDLDFLKRHRDGFTLEPAVYDALMETLAADVRVLESYKIMDFSLLIGVHIVDKVKKTTLIEQMTTNSLLSSQSLNAVKAKNSDGEDVVLFLGIIDILQSFSIEKQAEHTIKSIMHDGDTISVHNPAFYGKRFLNFMANKVFKRG